MANAHVCSFSPSLDSVYSTAINCERDKTEYTDVICGLRHVSEVSYLRLGRHGSFLYREELRLPTTGVPLSRTSDVCSEVSRL